MATGNAVYKTTFLQVDDRVYSKLAAAITAGATSLTVTLADAGLFPDLYPYILTIEDERVLVTNRVSNTLTITRAYDGTTAATHANKTYVALNIVSKSVSDLNAAVNTIEQAIVDGFINIKVLGAADYPIDMYAATVNSGGADIRLSNAAKIDNTVAGTLKLMTTTSGYVSISEGQIIAKCDYLDLDLDVALRFIGAGKNIDGAVIFRDNVTIGRSGAPVTNQVYGRVIIEPSTAVDYAIRINGTAILNSGEQAIYINVPNETVATNGIWITLGSTVTSGDLSGIRSRVTGNAASAGANVRGAYLEAKVGASKYAAQLEGALIHADYSAGGATVSGDVRGLTVHISQGSGLNAANLYGILLNIQTLGTETITTDDVGLLIRNEAVGGNGRTMDSALKITDLNMGGINGFYIGIDFTGITCTTAEIDLDFGKIIFDQDGDTDIHCDVDDEVDFKLSGSNFLIMAAGVVRPGTNNQVDLGSSSKQFKDIYIDGVGYIDTMAAFTLGGTISGGGQIIDTLAQLSGGNATTSFYINAKRTFANVGTGITIRTLSASDVDTVRVSIASGINEASWTFANSTLVGIKLGGALTLNGQNFDAGSGYAQIDTTGADQGLHIKSTQGSSGGPAMVLEHISDSPEVGNTVGKIYALGRNSVGGGKWYGNLAFLIENVTENTEAGKFAITLRVAGADNEALTLSSAGVVSPDHSIMFGQSQDLAAVADQVSLGGYEISAGHRALAIGCEEVVITEGLTPDRSLPIRINGVTYKLMLVAV